MSCFNLSDYFPSKEVEEVDLLYGEIILRNISGVTRDFYFETDTRVDDCLVINDVVYCEPGEIVQAWIIPANQVIVYGILPDETIRFDVKDRWGVYIGITGVFGSGFAVYVVVDGIDATFFNPAPSAVMPAPTNRGLALILPNASTGAVTCSFVIGISTHDTPLSSTILLPPNLFRYFCTSFS